MAVPEPSPRARKRFSLAAQPSNIDDNMTMPQTSKSSRSKNRATFGGLLNPLPAEDVSPATRARNMRPRKSILKPRQADENTEDTMIGAQLSQLPEESATLLGSMINRRVSFAPNMHVRQFQRPTPEHNHTLPRISAGPRPSNGSHSRRSSIQNINGVVVSTHTIAAPRIIHESQTIAIAPSANVAFAAGDMSQGEMSMDVETESESSDSDDDVGVQMGSSRQFNGEGARFSFGQPPAVIANREVPAEMEMSMDLSQNYGGIVNRQSLAPASADTSMASSAESDDKTMDFTVAIGGVLPHSPPVHAIRGRQSIGYTVPASPNSAGIRIHPGMATADDNDSIVMEETGVFGGIIGADESVSSGGTDDTIANRERTMTFSFNVNAPQDDGMDLTVAGGGIIQLPDPSPPSRGTPGFARPTVSSAQKSAQTEKRNVFAPSPSPGKSKTPQRGMAAAGDVAKRLSFGSTTPGGRKRARNESQSPEKLGSASKKARPLSASTSNVFATATAATTSQISSTPRKAASPRKSLSARMSLMGKSPARSPMLRRVLGLPTAENDGEGVWEPSTIKLGVFLEMAGVQFMDVLPGLHRRRSSVARGLLGTGAYGPVDREFGLEEYTAAQVNDIFLNMFTWASSKMKDDIKESQTQIQATEEDCDVHNPPVIREYLAAADEERSMFEMIFKGYKTNTQLKAKERWYIWKQDLMEKVRPDVEEMMAGMESDHERLLALEEESATLVPDLQDRLAALQAELIKERETVVELEEVDQEEIAGYRTAIAEQTSQVNAFASELAETMGQLEKLETNLAELEARRADATCAIMVAKSKGRQYTKSDVVRLQEEYDSLQALHLWRVLKVNEDQMVFDFSNEIRLSFGATAFNADISAARLELLPSENGGEEKHDPTAFLFVALEAAVREAVGCRKFKMLSSLVQHIGQLWSSAQRIRQEFRYTNLLYPSSFSAIEGQCVAETTMMIPAARSRISVEYAITAQTLREWPASAAGIEVGVRTVYGEADADHLATVARDLIRTATDEGCLGLFWQVCADLVAQY